MSKIDKSDRRWLHGEDLQIGGRWSEFALTIKAVGARDSAKTIDGQVIGGIPVSFAETDKQLILNATNERLCVCQFGLDHSKWVGQKLRLYPVMGTWFGQPDVLAVRVRVPPGKPRPFIQPKSLGKDLTK